MAKVYEALRRAEEERKRKASGVSSHVGAVEWDPSPQSAPRVNRSFLKRLLSKQPMRLDTASELNKRRISLLQPDSFVAEQFRTLRTRIDSAAAERPIKTIAVTSANAGDGKSTAALNLALVTAMSVGRQVLLIDCDMRRPRVHRSLGLEPRAGLAEILVEESTLDEAVMKVEGLNLDVLCVRTQPRNPSELLASEQMRSLVEEAGRRYDRVILDTPATLGLPDSKTVSELCDGIVMVVRAGRTPREDIVVALEILERDRVLGLVMNGASQGAERYSYYA